MTGRQIEPKNILLVPEELSIDFDWVALTRLSPRGPYGEDRPDGLPTKMAAALVWLSWLAFLHCLVLLFCDKLDKCFTAWWLGSLAVWEGTCTVPWLRCPRTCHLTVYDVTFTATWGPEPGVHGPTQGAEVDLQHSSWGVRHLRGTRMERDRKLWQCTVSRGLDSVVTREQFGVIIKHIS